MDLLKQHVYATKKCSSKIDVLTSFKILNFIILFSMTVTLDWDASNVLNQGHVNFFLM